MSRMVQFCAGALFIAALGACAAPAPEKQASANQQAKDDACDEVLGSRIKRCGGQSSGSGSVSGGEVPPGTTLGGPSGLQSK